MGRITVLIADDDALFRKGLGLLLAPCDDMQVVGEAGDPRQTLNLTETLRPRVLLLNSQMRDNQDKEILASLRERSPKTKVVLFSVVAGDDQIREALRQGAKGYLLKSATDKVLVQALRAVHQGETWAGRRVMSELLNSLTTDMSIKEARRSKLESQLTGREQEIVKGVAQGLTNKEIGKWLNISEKTVKTHLSNIFDKLKVTRRLQLLQYAEQRPPKKNTSVAR